MKDLTAASAHIFRIVHSSNVPWILDNGLHCKKSEVRDPNYIEIGNQELIQKRTERVVSAAPYRTLSDYVPFYFTPFSPMMYNIFTGHNGITRRPNSEIVILKSSLHRLAADGVPFIFSDRHAYLNTAQFSSNIADLDRIDWPLLQKRDFQRSYDDPGKVERYQAEALIYKHLPLASLEGIICYSELVATDLKREISNRSLNLKVAHKSGWYF